MFTPDQPEKMMALGERLPRKGETAPSQPNEGQIKINIDKCLDVNKGLFLTLDGRMMCAPLASKGKGGREELLLDHMRAQKELGIDSTPPEWRSATPIGRHGAPAEFMDSLAAAAPLERMHVGVDLATNPDMTVVTQVYMGAKGGGKAFRALQGESPAAREPAPATLPAKRAEKFTPAEESAFGGLSRPDRAAHEKHAALLNMTLKPQVIVDPRVLSSDDVNLDVQFVATKSAARLGSIHERAPGEYWAYVEKTMTNPLGQQRVTQIQCAEGQGWFPVDRNGNILSEPAALLKKSPGPRVLPVTELLNAKHGDIVQSSGGRHYRCVDEAGGGPVHTWEHVFMDAAGNWVEVPF